MKIRAYLGAGIEFSPLVEARHTLRRMGLAATGRCSLGWTVSATDRVSSRT